MAETQTITRNKPLTLALSNPSSQVSQPQSQLEDIIKSLRLAHINDMSLANKTIKECEETIEEQNNLLKDLWEEREVLIKEKEALLNIKPQQVIPLKVQNSQSKERFSRFKAKITNAGFKPRTIFESL